jgi:carboxyl-terminal processing protease
VKHPVGASPMFFAAALLAACQTPASFEDAGHDGPDYPGYLQTFSAMGADMGLSGALNAVRQTCPARMADALQEAVKEINAAPELAGRPPAVLDMPEPQSFVSLYNRLAAETSVDRDVLLRRSVDGLARGVDPKSDARGYVDLRAYTYPAAGIGVEIKNDGGRILVVSTLPDSPSSRAGLLPRDHITAIDSAEVTGLPLEDVADKLRGENLSEVELTLIREGQAGDFKVRMARAIVRSPGVSFRMQERIAIITLPSFQENTAKQLNDAIGDAQKAGATGYILDLRRNSGGLLDAVIEVASVFLEDGRVLSTVPPPDCGSTIEREDYNARRGFKLKGAPVVVLIGKDTASGAELFAATLAERGRARLVGQTTIGAAAVQTVFPLVVNSVMRIKTSELVTSQDKSIAGVGVAPTIAIPESEDALARALQLLASPS